MDYELLQPISSRSRRDMTSQEARAYFDWFINQIPSRLRILERAVRSSGEEPFRDWHADLSPDSLDVLGRWLELNVETKPVSERYREELEIERQKLDPKYQQLLQEPDWLLTAQSISLIHDVGMYLGEVFRKQLPELAWDLWTRNKRDVEYQEPVLCAPDLEYGIEPLGLIHVTVLKIAKGRSDPKALKRVFEVWLNKVTTDKKK